MHTIPKIHHRDRRKLSYDELHQLYIIQRLSACDIARGKFMKR